MASLQSIDRKGKSFYQIQFSINDSKRTTLRLGNIAQKSANEIFRHVEHLISAKKHGTPVREETEAWLRTVDARLKDKLFKYELAKKTSNFTIVDFVDAFISAKKDVSPRTKRTYTNIKRHLGEFFKPHRTVLSVTPTEAKEYQDWLRTVKKLGPNTARRRMGITRQMFAEAEDQELIPRNPFKQKSIIVSVGAGKKQYVSPEEIESVISACPSIEWKLLFGLSRYIGCRIPSELQELSWGDIHWDKETVHITSPKTVNKGRPFRLSPIGVYSQFRELLDEAFVLAADGQVYLFPTLRHHSNLSTTAHKIVKKAGLLVWPNFFNSLRASCETDLMDWFGLRRACAWIGNSPKVAMKNYALTKRTEFIDAGQKSEFPHRKSDAKSDAAGARIGENGEARTLKNPVNTVIYEASIGQAGLEPATKGL